MHLLLVDDEIHTAQRICELVEWNALGIRRVSVAHSMQQALNVFADDTVDILLSDIEMPQGSGIALAEWVRDQGLPTAIVFLTCHAQFAYAKDAMRLQSQDYLLKPIEKETLEASLSRTVALVRQQKQIAALTQSDALWQNNRANVMEYFWLQTAQGKFSGGEKELLRNAAERGLPLQRDVKLYATLIFLREHDKNWSQNDRQLITYAQTNIARELFEEENSLNAVAEYSQGTLLVICCPAEEKMLERLREDFIRYTEVCRKHLGLNVSCCISRLISPTELSATVEHMAKGEATVLETGDQVWVEDSDAAAKLLPDMKTWERMLLSGMYRQVREAVIHYFQDVINPQQFSSLFLRKFQERFVQIIRTFCQKKDIQIRDILGAEAEHQSRMVRTVPDMLIWINECLDRCQKIETAQKDGDPIREAKQYIMENLDQDISREDIARYVHLNPDYLSRLFKKELGVSVIDYLIFLRIEMAKKLLLETNMRVSDVATRVGYSNFSHFSKLFKKKVGVNPNQYKHSR